MLNTNIKGTLYSVNIKYTIVKVSIHKILVKSQKIVEHANSIWNNTTVSIYRRYITSDTPNIIETELYFIVGKNCN